MRCYEIYLVKEEIVEEYYGAEYNIFDLLYEYKHTTESEKRDIISKQLQFITHTIDKRDLFLYLEQFEWDKVDTINGVFIVESEDGEAQLRVQDDKLTLLVAGILDTEAEQFEHLRKWSHTWFAAEYKHHQFGWLSPMSGKRGNAKHTNNV